MSKARVLFADDHALVAEGLKSLLAEEFEIVGISPDGRRLVSDAGLLKPDVIVLDIGMPELNGVEVAFSSVRLFPGQSLSSSPGRSMCSIFVQPSARAG